jgi:hypothetical protein
MTRKFELLATLGPSMRARSHSAKRSAYSNAINRREELLRAKAELDLIIRLCKEVAGA